MNQITKIEITSMPGFGWLVPIFTGLFVLVAALCSLLLDKLG